jgi:hypothetical protein
LVWSTLAGDFGRVFMCHIGVNFVKIGNCS